jgi:hypothetical protein
VGKYMNTGISTRLVAGARRALVRLRRARASGNLRLSIRRIDAGDDRQSEVSADSS